MKLKGVYMSETSEDKSKRKFVDNLLSYDFSREIRIYFNEYDSGYSHLYSKLINRLKKYLSNRLSNSVLLTRITSHKAEYPVLNVFVALDDENVTKKEILAWLSSNPLAYTDKKSGEFIDYDTIGVQVTGRYSNEELLIGYAATVKKERPHNLSIFEIDIKRTTLLNSKNEHLKLCKEDILNRKNLLKRKLISKRK